MIKFWKAGGEFGCLSNFSYHPVIIDGVRYKTSEHYFQSEKFIDSTNKKDVIGAPTPHEAAKMGRDRSRPLRKDWEQVKDSIMEKVLIEKINQHPEVKKILLKTGSEEIVEDSPIDYYWGCGGDGTGKNTLGKLWMKIRDQIIWRSYER
jgi:ribA/ribD-fused uncharacterized protein